MTSEAPKFILDRELFPLTKVMRMLGFDTLSRGDLSLSKAVRLAIEERRIWVRKDIETPSLQYGIRYYVLQSDNIADQLDEINTQYVVKDFIEPFSRCLKCNQSLLELPRSEAKAKVPEKIFKTFQQFYICFICHRVYWPGSHLKRMKEKLKNWGW